jgi:DNA-binding XRE family transcriptional regulator
MREPRKNNKHQGVPDQAIRNKRVVSYGATKEPEVEVPPVKAKKVRDRMFGNKIRAILDEKGMCQQELADLALNGDRQHLSSIILGKKPCLSLSVAFRISTALGMPIEDVFVYKPNND